jgi:hypothetical protein
MTLFSREADVRSAWPSRTTTGPDSPAATEISSVLTGRSLRRRVVQLRVQAAVRGFTNPAGRLVIPDLCLRPAHGGVYDVVPATPAYNAANRRGPETSA